MNVEARACTLSDGKLSNKNNYSSFDVFVFFNQKTILHCRVVVVTFTHHHNPSPWSQDRFQWDSMSGGKTEKIVHILRIHIVITATGVLNGFVN